MPGTTNTRKRGQEGTTGRGESPRRKAAVSPSRALLPARLDEGETAPMDIHAEGISECGMVSFVTRARGTGPSNARAIAGSTIAGEVGELDGERGTAREMDVARYSGHVAPRHRTVTPLDATT